LKISKGIKKPFIEEKQTKRKTDQKKNRPKEYRIKDKRRSTKHDIEN
jgi:hypothetical protein